MDRENPHTGASAIAKQAAAWSEVAEAAQQLFVRPPLAAIRINIAAFVSHRLEDLCPAWVLSISPPGSGKTELDNALDQFSNVWAIDQLSPNTLVSGQIAQSRRRKPASLLHRIGPKGILIVKDLSSYLSNPRTLAVLMGQLRRVHDGAFHPEFGIQDHIPPWKGRITLLASITPDIDRYIGVLNKMGPRFVFVRWPRAGGIETGRRVVVDRTLARARFQTAVRVLISFACTNPVPCLDSDQNTVLSAAGEFVALSRGTVYRDSVSREADLEAVVEGNTRLPEELVQIARGSAMLEGRTAISTDDIALALRAAHDAIPSVRSKILSAIVKGLSPYSVRGIPEVMASRTVQDLEMLGLVESNDGIWRLADGASNLETLSGVLQAGDSQ